MPIDAVVVDQLVGRGQQVGVPRRPPRRARTLGDRGELLFREVDTRREADVLVPLVLRLRAPRDPQDHELAVARLERRRLRAASGCTRATGRPARDDA